MISPNGFQASHSLSLAAFAASWYRADIIRVHGSTSIFAVVRCIFPQLVCFAGPLHLAHGRSTQKASCVILCSGGSCHFILFHSLALLLSLSLSLCGSLFLSFSHPLSFSLWALSSHPYKPSAGGEKTAQFMSRHIQIKRNGCFTK